MPRPVTFKKTDIIDAAFTFVRREGIAKISARKLADAMNASTAPVYSAIGSIKAVKEEVILQARELLNQYVLRQYTREPHINTETGFILFARDEPYLFELLFLGVEKDSEDLKFLNNRIREQMNACSEQNVGNKTDFPNEFSQRWRYVLGFATEVYIASAKPDEPEVVQALERFKNSRTTSSVGEQIQLGF